MSYIFGFVIFNTGLTLNSVTFEERLLRVNVIVQVVWLGEVGEPAASFEKPSVSAE